MSSDDELLDDLSLRQTHHRWEHTGKSWDTLLSKDGQLVSIMKDGSSWENQYQKRRNLLRGKVRGLIRSVVLVIDLSEAGLAPLDFGMPRIRLIIDELTKFISNFLDQNPLSQLSIVTTFDYQAQIQIPLSSDVNEILSVLKHLNDVKTSGEPSIYNSILVATNLLKTVPVYSTKEILVIYSSLSTCDPKSFDVLIASLIDGVPNLNNNTFPTKVVISAIGLGAEVDFLKRLAETTNGSYNVPISRDHFVDLLQAQVLPPAWNERTQRRRFIPFGFTKSVIERPSFDLKNLFDDGEGESNQSSSHMLPSNTSICCPQCRTRVFSLPNTCPCCGLLLLSPAHLTRSSQHLKPLDEFKEDPSFLNRYPMFVCDACNQQMNEVVPFICLHCHGKFCKSCNQFIHECLQQCPVCLLKRNNGPNLQANQG
ncbi:General transcription factor IIH subunit 2 [Tritrichomonas musculus]|uniref:General transcription factor IIH subunit 2 n=1 Tax=Tritrichomonas musculus TaxID=1915356 RepID=A0ABR2K2U0_9EUKA